MTAVEAAPAQRRLPTQARSRRTVERILDAAEAIIDEQGVAAATTRAIADKAGVAYPSLYRFFSDREEILDVLLERHTADSDAIAMKAEAEATLTSALELLDLELEMQIQYYRQRPSAAKLWLEGRVSDRMREAGQRRMRALAERIHHKLIECEFVPADTDLKAVRMMVELGDRVIEFAYRENLDFDEDLLAIGRQALAACVLSVAPA